MSAGDEVLRAALAELADDFDSEVDWSDGRSNYGDNEAWESAARRPRALLAAAAPTPDEVGQVEGPWWTSGKCPRCHERKFLGHGPLCPECYDATTGARV